MEAAVLRVSQLKSSLGGRWRGSGRREGLAWYRCVALLDGDCGEYDGFGERDAHGVPHGPLSRAAASGQSPGRREPHQNGAVSCSHHAHGLPVGVAPCQRLTSILGLSGAVEHAGGAGRVSFRSAFRRGGIQPTAHESISRNLAAMNGIWVSRRSGGAHRGRSGLELEGCVNAISWTLCWCVWRVCACVFD